MSAQKALARTVDLVRADVFPRASDNEVIAALTGVRMRLVADERNLSCAAGQTAVVTAAIVAAQSGAELVLDLPDVPLLASQPPLRNGRLAESLMELTSDLIVRALHDEGQRCDLTVAVGSTPVKTAREPIARIAPLVDGFELVPGDIRDAAAWSGNEPFGALFGGVAAGAEAFRAAMRRLAAGGHEPRLRHAARKLRPVRLRTPKPTGSRVLGRLDVISGGAITHGMIYALLRVPQLDAALRVFDHDVFDWPNLNRYLLGRRSSRRTNKAELLAAYSHPGLRIASVPRRYDDRVAASADLADFVAVGVDDIPSRWRAQQHAAGVVVVGATSHFEVVVSEHLPGTACAGCLYPDGEDDGSPIPTVSFVSAFSGILQAYRLLNRPPADARQTRAAPVNLAGDEPLTELGVMPRRGCPVGCLASVNH